MNNQPFDVGIWKRSAPDLLEKEQTVSDMFVVSEEEKLHPLEDKVIAYLRSLTDMELCGLLSHMRCHFSGWPEERTGIFINFAKTFGENLSPIELKRLGKAVNTENNRRWPRFFKKKKKGSGG